MKADNINLLEFISASKRTFTIPVYQRNYDWKRSQCETLFHDIEKIAMDERRNIHFLGTIVYIQGNDTANFREFIVIDGQQRITSVMLLLKALQNMITEKDTQDDIYESFLINKRAPEEFRLKLKPMKSDYSIYKEIINGEINELADSTISTNYKLFIDLMKESHLTPEEIYLGIQKLEIVYIQLSRESENPQLIFESLNSTGLDLTQADLIRNYLLMGQEYKVQEKLYSNYWVKIEKILPDMLISDFVRDYLTLKTNIIPNKDKVYSSFKEYYGVLENYDAEGLLDELKTYSEYYSWFKYCNSPDENINIRLMKLQKLKSTVVYPFLLSIFEDCYYYNNIDVEELCSALDVVISYVFRRLICDLPTNALNKIFATLAKDVSKIEYDNLSLAEKISIVLINKKGKVTFPNNILFKDSFLSKDFYHFKQGKFLLEELEKNKNKEVVCFDNVTIEHIMPQTLSPKWQVDLGKKYKEIHETYLNKVGNLTLTGYNSELSNKSFGEKKQYLLDSGIQLNREIAKCEAWNENSIKERSNKLLSVALELWSYPNVDKKYLSNEVDTGEYEIMDDIDVTGKSPYEVEICGIKFPVSSWRSFFLRICCTMYEYNSQIFISLLRHNDFQGRKKRIITDDINTLREPGKVSDGIYIEQNLSANDALNYSKLVVEKFEGMEEEVVYKIR